MPQIEILHIDCMEYMASLPDKAFDLAIVDRIHPTQKPVALYRWLLQNYAKPGQRILDTHLGSAAPSRSPATWKASPLLAVKLTRTTSRPLGIG
jgi:DNA modification methylase